MTLGYFHVREKFGKVKKDLTLPSPVINFSMTIQNDCRKKNMILPDNLLITSVAHCFALGCSDSLFFFFYI